MTVRLSAPALSQKNINYFRANKMIRTRFFRIFGAFLMFPGLFMMQVRPAQAVLPIIAAGATAQIVFATGAVVAAGALSAMTPGTALNSLVFGPADSPPTSRASGFGDVPVGTRDRDHLDVPSGWPNAYTKPAYTSPILNGWSKFGVFTLSQQDACSGYNNTNATYTAGSVADNLGSCLCSGSGCPYPGYTTYVNAVQSCGAVGVAPTVSNCTHPEDSTGTAIKPADGRCQILASVSGFTVDPQDPECGGLSANGVTVTPNAVTATDKKGNTRTITINGDGSRTITETTVAADGKTTIKNTITVAPNTVNGVPVQTGDGVVTGTKSETFAGTGALTSPTVTVPPIDFPNDYNREVTQGQIKTGVDKLHDDLNSDNFVNDLDAQNSGAQSALEQAQSAQKSAIDALPGQYSIAKAFSWPSWFPDIQQTGCTPYTGTVMGRSMTIDLCRYVNQINALLGWMMALMVMWHIGQLAFRPRGE